MHEKKKRIYSKNSNEYPKVGVE